MNRKVIKRAVAGDFRRKGLLRGITDWNLNERGQAVRDYLKGVAAALSVGYLGMMNFGQSERYNVHEPRNDLRYTDSGKAMSKRRKRRLRGKAK